MQPFGFAPLPSFLKADGAAQPPIEHFFIDVFFAIGHRAGGPVQENSLGFGDETNERGDIGLPLQNKECRGFGIERKQEPLLLKVCVFNHQAVWNLPNGKDKLVGRLCHGR